jgi:predicted acetyltransferase
VTFTVRQCRDRDELARAINAIGHLFARPPDDARLDRFLQVTSLDRTFAAFDGDEIVGGCGSFPFDLTVPGGSLACAGVSVVGVYPMHRRRGALRAMMEAQLADAHRRGEPIAALWASEETIYGRFGYGLASWCGEVAIPRVWSGYAQPFEPRGRVRFVDADEAVTLFPPVFDALRRERAGVVSRTEAWWRTRRISAPMEDDNPRRLVVLDVDGETQAYAMYKRHPAFDGAVSTARIEVIEAVGANPHATAEIWRYFLDADWTDTITASLLPPDHPLFLLLATPRRARYTLYDALWVRLVDVGAALSGRSYAADGTVVFDVRDTVCPWNAGRWSLKNGTATQTSADPDIALDVAALGAAYLGAVSFRDLASALRLEELRPGAVARADAMFAARPLPWCPEIF